jgi:hypothetical protein
MSMTFDKVRALVQRGEVRLSDHGYDEMSDENILARDVLAGVFDGVWSKTILCMPRTMCPRAAKGSRPAVDPRRLGDSEGSIVTGGCCDCVQA